ncbi:MAG: hypothetical protein V4608_10765 [Bacteroidota bacterium]
MNQQTIEAIVRATVEQLTKSKPEKVSDKRERWRQENRAYMERIRAKLILNQMNQA